MSKKEYLDRHGKPIDVYTYPVGVDDQAMRDYQHAVEVAHQRDGLPVEFFYNKTMEWQTVLPDFNWDRRQYRIAAPKIAKGHNPDRLTEEQVGVSEGWRLLEPEEIADREKADTIEMWLSAGYGWSRISTGGSLNLSYRTKQPPGYYLPKKQETDEEAMRRLVETWAPCHSVGNLGLAMQVLQWERERVRNGGNK